MLSISKISGGVAFWIHVTPRARRPKVAGCHGDALRVAVVEPPVDGSANAACIGALAGALEVRRGAVSIDLGSRGRRKRVRVEGDFGVLSARLQALATAGGSQ